MTSLALSDARLLELLPGLCDELGVSAFYVGRRRVGDHHWWTLDLHDERHELFSGFGSLVNAWTEAERKFRVGQARYATESLRISETEGSLEETGT